MGKYYTSIICLEFAYNNRYANSKEEYIELEDHEITEIMEHENE